MQELNDLFKKAVEEYTSSREIEERIKAQVKKTFDDLIDSAFSYGDIKDKIKAVIKENVRIDPSQVDLGTYNVMLEDALKRKLLEFKENESAKRFADTLDKMFGTPPKQIDIHDFVNTVIEKKKEDCYDIEDYREHAKVETKSDFEGTYKTFDITIEFEKESRYPSGDKVSLHLTCFNSDKWKIGISHKQHVNPTAMYDIEAYIFQLYAAGTEILDVEEFNEHALETRLRDYD